MAREIGPETFRVFYGALFPLAFRPYLSYVPDVPLRSALSEVSSRGSARLYTEVARRSFRRFSTYRGATIAGVFTNTVFGFLKAYVLLAVVSQRGEIGGLDATGAVTFTFVSQGFLATVGIFGELELAERIRTGDVVVDLYRPFDFQRYWLSQDLGRAAFQGIFRGIPPFLAGALVFDLRVPSDPAIWCAFALSVVLAVVVSFAVRFLTVLSGFWLLDARGPTALMGIVTQFFSGVLIPVTFFPAWLAHVAFLLPFVAMVQLPIEIFLGQRSGPGEIAGVLAVQVAWAVVLLWLGRVVLARATRKVVVQGG